MTDWHKNLRKLNKTAILPLQTLGLRKPWDGKLKTDIGDGKTDVTPEHGYRSPAMRRQVTDLRPVNAHALQHLAYLPGPGEAYHFLVGDRLSLWDIIPAILERKQPDPIAELWISTLSFGSATAAALLKLIDAGKILRVHFLVSVMFSAKNRHLFDELVPHLLKRGHRAAAMRTHAKIMAIELASGDRYIIESSSNLRSCHCAEQTTVIRDDGLFAFHRGWMDKALAGKG